MKAQDIIKKVENLSKHLGAYEEYMLKLGKNLGTTVNMYNQANKEFVKIDKDVLKISGEAIEIKPQVLEKPNVEDD